jgi:hypothetical protein
VEVIPDQPAPPTKIITKLEDFAEMFSDLEQEGALAFDIETYYPAVHRPQQHRPAHDTPSHQSSPKG